MKTLMYKGLAFVIGSSIGLSAAVYSEEARITAEKKPEPFPIILEEIPEEEPEKPVKLTAGERQMLERIAICEAGHTDSDAMAMIMRTILNRVENDEGMFPDTVEEVLYQKVEGHWQFAAMAPHGAYWSVEPNEASAEAVEMIENGYESDGSLFFNSEGLKSWASRNREYLYTVGGNDFYK